MKIKTNHQNLWARTEILKEKFIALNSYIRKKRKSIKQIKLSRLLPLETRKIRTKSKVSEKRNNKG